MSSSLALLLWAVLLVGLLRFDPAREPKVSWALWAPVVWMFIAASRLPSQWFGGTFGVESNALQEGSPVDRMVYSLLIVLSILTLAARSFKWDAFFRRNMPLMAFLGFALVSFLWSDYPFIAFKRWFRDIGDYVVILVVLSDPRPLDAIRTVLRRVSYLLIPLSIVLIKYFEMGKHYSIWTGAAEYVGVATSKNTLGNLCLISGLAFFWDTATRWSDRKSRRTKQIILVNLALLGMTFWLLNLSSSATSRVCLLLGCVIIAAAQSRVFRRRPGLLATIVPTIFGLYLFVGYGLGMNGQMATAVGRDPTLTGRTVIWGAVLSTHTNPILGTGYESFWLGSRLMKVWALTGPGINEAHNGCLDIYLNLGIAGLLLLLTFLFSSYGRIYEELKRGASRAPLALALWTVLAFASVTEAVFKNGLTWMVLLLGVVSVPAAVSVGENVDSAYCRPKELSPSMGVHSGWFGDTGRV